MNWKLVWSILAGIMVVSIFVMCAFISITGMAGLLDSEECQNCTEFLESGEHDYMLEGDCPVTICPVVTCLDCPVCVCQCSGTVNDRELFSYEDMSVVEQQSLIKEAEYLLERNDCYKNAVFDLSNHSSLEQSRIVNGPVYEFNKVFHAWIITRIFDGNTQVQSISSGKVVIDIDKRLVECNLPEYKVVI